MDRLMIGLGQPHALLDTQYRMHPAISAFPAAHFYGGRLKDDPSTLSRSEAPLRLGPLASLGPLALLHVRGAREEAVRDGSVRNMAEAAAICDLLLELRGRGVDVRSASRVKAPPLHAMTPLALSRASLALPSPRAPPSRLSRNSRARTPSSSPPVPSAGAHLLCGAGCGHSRRRRRARPAGRLHRDRRWRAGLRGRRRAPLVRAVPRCGRLPRRRAAAQRRPHARATPAARPRRRRDARVGEQRAHRPRGSGPARGLGALPPRVERGLLAAAPQRRGLRAADGTDHRRAARLAVYRLQGAGREDADICGWQEDGTPATPPLHRDFKKIGYCGTFTGNSSPDTATQTDKSWL